VKQDSHFQTFVKAGNPTGQVTAINSFVVSVSGLQPVSRQALICFEDGSKGFVQHILEDSVTVLYLGVTPLKVGMGAVVQHNELVTKVGKDFIGRVISVTGEPLDGKGAIAADGTWPIFGEAPQLYERELLDTQLETGVTLIDTLFPIARGQRLALLGDSKSGKSTLATQIAINQRNTDQVVVYVMIAKRRSDIDMLIHRLTENNALDKAIVIVSTVFESLVLSWLAPYVGCAMAEYLWRAMNQDAIVLYDDLTTHAQIYREISLLSGVSPGRDSYPGDIFHTHSQLLERAGKLKKNHRHLTAIPLVLIDGGDITGFIPTNIMSITDGQWILDMDVFREGLRPAVSVGLSVTRVGGRGQNDRQKAQHVAVQKAVGDFLQAREFAKFGSELALTTQQAMERGHQLYDLFTQIPGETFNLMAQQIMLDILLSSPAGAKLDINQLKTLSVKSAALVKTEKDYSGIVSTLRQQIGPIAPTAPQPAAAPAPAAPNPEAKP